MSPYLCRYYYTTVAICLFKLNHTEHFFTTLIILVVKNRSLFVTVTFLNCSSSHEKSMLKIN